MNLKNENTAVNIIYHAFQKHGSNFRASGLNGQKFAFHGYLPIDAKDRQQAIRELEKESKQKNQTQLFIETPYRNQTVFNDLVKSLGNTTLLTVAYDITGSAEMIKTKAVADWKKEKVTLDKLPCVFLLLAEA